MKLSVTNSVPVSETEQFEYIKRCGFDAVDFGLGKYFGKSGMFADIDNVTDEQIKEHFTMLKGLADKAGIEIGQTHSQFTGHPRHYDGIEDVIKREIACIKATHYLGCKYVVIHPIIMRERRYDVCVEENFNAAVDFYKKLVPYLEEYDVYGCTENMWNRDIAFKHICSTICSHIEEMNAICDAVGDRLKICVDIGHAPLTQDDAGEMIREGGDRVVVLHTHDNDGVSDLHTFPFSSHAKNLHSLAYIPMRVNWQDTMSALAEIDYKGNLNFEMSPPGPAELNEAGLIYLADIGGYLNEMYETAKNPPVTEE